MPTTRTLDCLMRVDFLAAVLGAVLVAGPLEAQRAREAAALDSVPISILDAEERGRRFAPLIARPALPALFSDSTVAGSAERRCVHAGEQAMIRAGDFLIGPFTERSRQWWSKKLWWVPASLAGELQVIAVHLERAAPSRIIRQPHVAHPSGGDPTDTFHPSTVGLYAPGPWMLVATSGSSWGCVLVDVP